MKPRRQRGSGTIYQRKDGRFVGKIWLTDSIGQRRRFEVFAKTKREVTDKLRKLTASESNQTLVAPDRTTLAAFLDQWLRTVAIPTKRPSTVLSYTSTINNHLIPAIGNRAIQRLTPAEIQAALASLDAGQRTRQLCYVVLHAALEQAVKWNIIPRNPARAVERPRTARAAMRVYSPAQVATFLKAAKADRLFALFLLALSTGLRQGELFALRWRDVDLKNGQLNIQNSLDRSTRKLQPVKTGRGQRHVAISPMIVNALKEHIYMSKTMASDHVFMSADGNPLDASNFMRRHYKPIVEAAGLPYIRFHDLRHTAATLMLLAGVNVKVIAERLGHASAAFTLDTYAHVLPSMQKDAALALDQYLKGAGRVVTPRKRGVRKMKNPAKRQV